MRRIRFRLNGVPAEVDVRDGARLYWALSRVMDVPPPRGCGVGTCGTCTVLLDGRPVPTCILPAEAADGGDLVVGATGSSTLGDTLAPAEHAAMARVLHGEGQRREHLVVVVGGAHAAGLASAGDDLALEGVHVAPTRALLGLEPPPPEAERTTQIDGVRVRYRSLEIRGVLAGLLAGDGTCVERVWGRLVCTSSPELERLQERARTALSTRFHGHYHALSTRLRARATPPTAARVLAMLRAALTGAHLLETGETRVELAANASGLGLDLGPLRAAWEADPDAVLADAAAASELMDRALAALNDALQRSPLPQAADPRPLEQWLLATRRRRL